MPDTGMTIGLIKALGGGASEAEVEELRSAIAKVTPEQFGAKGDGTTDDSEAVQAACNAGYEVRFEDNKTYYLASAVTIDHDVHLVGGKNTVIKTKTPSGGTVNNAIVVSGTLKKTTTLTTNYSSVGTTANSGNQFTLSDMTGISIGDILVIEAQDQYYSYARQYYYLGGVLLVSDIYNSHIYTSNSLPWDIENTANVTVKIYSSPTVIIENLDFVSDLDSRGNYRYLVSMSQCKNSVIRNCNLSNMDNGVYLVNCVNTLIDCVTVSKSKYDNSLNGDGYGIVVYSCSETNIQRVLSICAQGCVSMGGNIPNINTYIRNCNITSECRAVGLDMHENSYNVVVEDCTMGGLSLYGTAFVNRCRFIKNNRSGDNTAIVFRGSHNPKWATLNVTDCVIDGNDIGIMLTVPIPQSPVQSFGSIIGDVGINNCKGGSLYCFVESIQGITSHTINRIAIENWTNCKEIYNQVGNHIKFLKLADVSFEEYFPINKHSSSIYLDGIEYIDYSSTNPMIHKVHVGRQTKGEVVTMPENVSIALSSNNASAKFVVCGSNLASDNADDYVVGYVSGSVGGTLTKTAANGSGAPVISVDASGNLVYTQKNNTSEYGFYPVGMFYVKETSEITMSATIKNTGSTAGAKFYPYIAEVDCETGLVALRQNGTRVEATAEGVQSTFSYGCKKNRIAMCYFGCASAVANSVTTFEDFTITCTPYLIPVQNRNEQYTAKRLTGDGTILSLEGINNIMSSEMNFNVSYDVDYVSNLLH